MASAFSVQSDPGVVFKFFSASQQSIRSILKEIITSPIVKEIADNHGKTPAQIALRQHVQRGIVVIPKSTHKERMKQNLDVFDFELTDKTVRRK